MKHRGTPSLPELRSAMTAAARAAARELMRRYETPLEIRRKPGAGLVSDADLAAEKASFRVLEKARPDFSILSEETGKAGAKSREARGRWVIDPLDGTTNYLHGFPLFCVSIGAEWEGRLLAGLIHQPVFGDTYFAMRERGAFLNGRRLKVSNIRKLDDALLSTGFSYRKGDLLGPEIKAFSRVSARAHAVRRPGSAALDLAYVARGVFSGFWERKLSPWDVAAGIVLIEEAGGRVTDFAGKPYQLGGPEILATNSIIHPALLRAVSG